MQYDENAEKYGYEGEMTPLKCDKLTAYKGDVTIPVYGSIADAEVYLKKEADEAIAEIKKKLEDVQASMYADVVDANMEVRRLKRALYKACAEWALSTLSWLDCIDQGNPVKWGKMRWKCLKKAEEYK